MQNLGKFCELHVVFVVVVVLYMYRTMVISRAHKYTLNKDECFEMLMLIEFLMFTIAKNKNSPYKFCLLKTQLIRQPISIKIQKQHTTSLSVIKVNNFLNTI
jgi:hypothetical protein